MQGTMILAYPARDVDDDSTTGNKDNDDGECALGDNNDNEDDGDSAG